MNSFMRQIFIFKPEGSTEAGYKWQMWRHDYVNGQTQDETLESLSPSVTLDRAKKLAEERYYGNRKMKWYTHKKGGPFLTTFTKYSKIPNNPDIVYVAMRMMHDDEEGYNK